MLPFASRLGRFLLGNRSGGPSPSGDGSASTPILSQLRSVATDARDILFPPLELDGEMPVRMRSPLCVQCGDFISARAEDVEGEGDAESVAGGPEVAADLTVEADSLMERCDESWADAASPALCRACRVHIASLGAYSYQWARAAYRAQGRVRSAVHAFKYHGEWSLRNQLAGWLEEAYDFHALVRRPTWDGLVPVPLHTFRRYWRCFNQAEELAQELGRRRGVPLMSCLRRTRFTPTQTNLARAQRWRNMHGAFELQRGVDVRGLHLLIVDDVFTTGATCDACARVLMDKGAAQVGIITVARG